MRRQLERQAVSMKPSLGFAFLLTVTACAGVPDVALPSARTISKVESGHQLLADLTAVGAHTDADVLNAESRVRVRNASCRAADASAATCRYEASRCLDDEIDTDGDGWCARTSRFVKVGGQRGIGDVVVKGWAIER